LIHGTPLPDDDGIVRRWRKANDRVELRSEALRSVNRLNHLEVGDPPHRQPALVRHHRWGVVNGVGVILTVLEERDTRLWICQRSYFKGSTAV
jgi:hypothetical protein